MRKSYSVLLIFLYSENVTSYRNAVTGAGRQCFFKLDLSWLWRSDVGLALRRPWLDIRPVHVLFVVDKVTLKQFSLPILWFPSVSIISPIRHTPSLTRYNRSNIHHL
jgi:hypothetical protein